MTDIQPKHAGQKERRLKPVMGKPGDSYLPASAPLHVVSAIQAVAAGDANERQQKLAIEWIIEKGSAAHSFNGIHGGPEADRESQFALGRAFVGKQILGLLKIDLVALLQPPTKGT